MTASPSLITATLWPEMPALGTERLTQNVDRTIRALRRECKPTRLSTSSLYQTAWR
jgi:hypothetical protein